MTTNFNFYGLPVGFSMTKSIFTNYMLNRSLDGSNPGPADRDFCQKLLENGIATGALTASGGKENPVYTVVGGNYSHPLVLPANSIANPNRPRKVRKFKEFTIEASEMELFEKFKEFMTFQKKLSNGHDTDEVLHG